MMVRKPEGAKETEYLLRKLVKVPKKEVDAEVAKTKKKAKKRKKKS